PALNGHFARLLGLVERLLLQERHSKDKLYSLHAPEVVCLAKGKANKAYEFGAKVSLAVTNREGFALAAKALAGNPYDGHTLATTVEQIVALTGTAPERIYVDKGYRGHDYPHKERVFLSGQRRGLTPSIHRELRRRAAIEPMIGHMKTDGSLNRNYLLGTAGDAINALLVAAAHNLRLILARLRLFFACLLLMLPADQASSRHLQPGARSIVKLKVLCSGPTTYATGPKSVVNFSDAGIKEKPRPFGAAPSWSLLEISSSGARPPGRGASRGVALQRISRNSAMRVSSPGIGAAAAASSFAWIFRRCACWRTAAS